MASARAAMTRLSALVPERSLFQHEPFRRLWTARLLSHIPGNALVYMMLLLVVDATGKAFSSSLFVAAYIAPTALREPPFPTWLIVHRPSRPFRMMAVCKHLSVMPKRNGLLAALGQNVRDTRM